MSRSTRWDARLTSRKRSRGRSRLRPLRERQPGGAFEPTSSRCPEQCRDQGLEPGATDVDGGHGRVETRRCWTMKVGGRGLIDSERWANVNSIALIETERFEADPSAEGGSEDSSMGGEATIGGETTTEKRYVLSSLPPDATRLLWGRLVGTGGSRTVALELRRGLRGG